jgi:7-cyano-7-deazaguanine reductase
VANSIIACRGDSKKLRLGPATPHDKFRGMSAPVHQELETFPNPAPDRDYTIRMSLPEFTCLCPKTGQPDFATLELEYVPDRLCVELKSLKLYIWSFRDRGTFHEAVTNEIASHLDGTLAPRFLRLTARFNVRGGIYTTVVVERRQQGWQPPTPVTLP